MTDLRRKLYLTWIRKRSWKTCYKKITLKTRPWQVNIFQSQKAFDLQEIKELAKNAKRKKSNLSEFKMCKNTISKFKKERHFKN